LIRADDLVLVTGSNGFIGSHVSEALLARGYRVRCMVRRSSDLTFIQHLPVEWVHADVRDTEALRQACQGVDAVCHCAALTRALNEETFQRVNAAGAETLGRICIEASPNLQRFLFLSSQTAAGPSQGTDDYVDESRPPQPITWYGKSKLAAERALMGMDGLLPLTIVRSAAVFGPRDRDFYSYFDLVKRGFSLRLRREDRLSFVYVRDLVGLILLALENDIATGQTYFGCGTAHSYAEFSEAVARALGKRPLRITLPEAVLTPMALWARAQGRLTGRPALLNEQRVHDMRQRYWLCSGEKAQRELGFVPKYDLDTAVQETASWYLENEWL
jgi:nucleoside-diphosphate-sugar epimerase